MYNPDDDYQLILARLKAICKKKNISQYALAKATGMSTSSMSCLMRGETKPYMYTMLIICDALNVAMGDLFESHGLSEEEENLVSAYSYMSPEKKRMVEVYVDMLLQYNRGLCETI